MPEQPYDHNNNRDQEDEDGDPVHAMHHKNVGIARIIRISFAQIEVSKYLPPHNSGLFLKLRK